MHTNWSSPVDNSIKSQNNPGDNMLKVYIDGEVKEWVNMYFFSDESSEWWKKTDKNGIVRTIANIWAIWTLTLSYGNGSHAEIKGFKLTENITKVMAASTSALDIAMATRNK